MQVLFRLSEDLQTMSWEKKGLQGLGRDMAMGFGKMMLGGFAKSADTARRVDLSTLVEVLQVRACPDGEASGLAAGGWSALVDPPGPGRGPGVPRGSLPRRARIPRRECEGAYVPVPSRIQTGAQPNPCVPACVIKRGIQIYLCHPFR